ncbi:MAG: winged helix-turn-helix domain-containing protein [Candidatus Parvarchaeota archaeon]|nr:winged helix-turn-helix domain-containing protein [Candidatus Jingweiarchaeum tengchongense]MCW1298226.1 winged helix-turn-helix domain-containing protein [Candidatus Jingweiarchaeum tengchongense]MCW1300024.1 winged helix-turn-helix domain-containing protein [Candidatus Jingweiarchaeum tengchongense]MCW1304837.1 winged helix-turn-helix domain-containing protein [Candidatus Jingweiarchaeum tengchongense]MCW1305427.1 winged helix-turn-helix domain-containing protein [Candidatus Jingweiarchaeu
MEITKESLKVIVSDTRLKILKSLSQRRKTLSELARELNLAFSTTKEHLDKLIQANLITKVDDGHKWKYYELTPQAQKLFSHKAEIVLILGSISLMLIGIIGLSFQLISTMSMQPTIEKVAMGGEEAMILIPPKSLINPFYLFLAVLGFAILLKIYIRRLRFSL